MEGNNRTKFFSIVIILLLIIIIILLFFSRFGKIETDQLIPTGNVDVFDIDINCNCKGNNCTVVDDNGNTIPVFNEEDSIIGKVYVDDNNGKYIYQQNLRIFENSAFEYTNLIAPGTSNTYQFVVHNSTNAKLKYDIKMHEETEYNINLKYRLRQGKNYIIGNEDNWVDANSLVTQFNTINANTSDKYSLDWKWEYEGNTDASDTIAGKNMSSNYKLYIRFYFEQVD